MNLTVITCTGGRQEAFSLCERWMERQTFGGDVQWIVVDDCEPATRVTMGQRVIRPEPKWSPGNVTLGRNIVSALPAVKHDRIIYVEDDDHIGPLHLGNIWKLLDSAVLAGEYPARYYHAGTGRYRVLQNTRHASLGQTGMRSEMIPALLAACAMGDPYIDLKLWRGGGCLEPSGNVVGMKGLPGRPGIGVGHRANKNWLVDADGSVLRTWIGANAAAYQEFAQPEAA